MTESLINRVMDRAHEGMEIAVVAEAYPDRIALVSDQGEHTFAELNRQANQIARLLREQGIGAGDAVALVCSNRAEFAAVRFATHRIGARLTPVNWHLSAAEISYIVGNCEALALFADSRVATAVEQVIVDNPGLRLKLAIGGAIAGCQQYQQALAAVAADNIDNPCLGTAMLYTSGTTGKPKGVLRKQPDPEAAAAMLQLMLAVFHYDPEAERDMALATGPLYHAGPFNICLTQPLSAGIGSVLMDRWEPEQTLSLIARHRISHCFLVPTMFTRMLQLPPELRVQYDLSSLKFVIHGAAPCAIATKQQMLDWFGPIIWELFAGTEGAGTVVSPAEWLSHPGTVGKPGQDQMKIYDPDGAELGPGQVGTVYLKNPSSSAFEYFRDREKTLSVHRGDYFTAGDMGYLDEAGYLFLTGRSAELIIAGGVNIYPQEIDDVLAQHPAVLDVACVGVPNEEWGEEVKAVIALVSTYPACLELERELLAFAQQRLSRQKWPRSIDFVTVLPRSEAGKVQRSTLRQRYWEGHGRQL